MLCDFHTTYCISRDFREVFIFASEHENANMKTHKNNLLHLGLYCVDVNIARAFGKLVKLRKYLPIQS